MTAGLLSFDDEMTMLVALDGEHTFTCTVGPWDTTEDRALGAEEALRMARGLIFDDGVELYGELDGCYCVTIIDPARVVGIALAGIKR